MPEEFMMRNRPNGQPQYEDLRPPQGDVVLPPQESRQERIERIGEKVAKVGLTATIALPIASLYPAATGHESIGVACVVGAAVGLFTYMTGCDMRDRPAGYPKSDY